MDYIEPAADVLPEVAVVIPAYHESSLASTLHSLWNSNFLPYEVAVIVVINHPESASPDIKLFHQNQAHQLSQKFTGLHESLKLHIVKAFDLALKHAGVGLARKIGLDQAVTLLDPQAYGKGILVSLDADTIVQPNYIMAIHDAFIHHHLNSASIHFEHQWDNESGTTQEAAIFYEIHLRLYLAGLRKAGYPLAFQTVGSAMACTVDAYTKQGGMVKNKAGEDFYFMQKLMPLGRMADIVTTKVYPSSRVSTRVPFGTGRAISQYHQRGIQYTYHPNSYNFFQDLIQSLEEFVKHDRTELIMARLPSPVVSYAHQIGLIDTLINMRAQAASAESFRKRMFNWFNPFQVMKFFHAMRDNGYPDVSVEEALISNASVQSALKTTPTARESLYTLRKYDQQNPKMLTLDFQLVNLPH